MLGGAELEELLAQLSALDKLCLYDEYDKVVADIERSWNKSKPEHSGYYAVLLFALDKAKKLRKIVDVMYYRDDIKSWCTREPSYLYNAAMVLRWEPISGDDECEI